MGTTHNESPTLRTMTEDSADEFYMASSGEGSSSLPVSRRCITRAPPAPVAITPLPENAPTTQTMMMVPPWTLTLWLDTGSPPEQRHAFREGQ
jgi:hypothetical protein